MQVGDSVVLTKNWGVLKAGCSGVIREVHDHETAYTVSITKNEKGESATFEMVAVPFDYFDPADAGPADPAPPADPPDA